MDGFVLISAVNLMGRVLCGGGCLDDSLVCGVFNLSRGGTYLGTLVWVGRSLLTCMRVPFLFVGRLMCCEIFWVWLRFFLLKSFGK